MTPTPDQPLAPCRDPDEINLLEYAYVLVKHKRLIIGLTLLGMVLGYVAALIKGPVFRAEVLIAPKESDASRVPDLSGLGALGGLATQLAFGTNPGLDRIETILGTRKFNAELVEKYNLLPDVYRVLWPRAYRKWYDKPSGGWKLGFQPPVMSSLGGLLAKKVIKRETSNTNNTMTIGVKSCDSLFSHALMTACVEFLNQYVRESIQQDARANVAYLDSTLLRITDPLLREKVQGLIASEIEKMMVVSKEAFQVMDPVATARDYRHRKLYPIALGFVLFLLAVLWVLLGHAIAGPSTLPEDRENVAGIRRELRRW